MLNALAACLPGSPIPRTIVERRGNHPVYKACPFWRGRQDGIEILLLETANDSQVACGGIGQVNAVAFETEMSTDPERFERWRVLLAQIAAVEPQAERPGHEVIWLQRHRLGYVLNDETALRLWLYHSTASTLRLQVDCGLFLFPDRLLLSGPETFWKDRSL